MRLVLWALVLVVLSIAFVAYAIGATDGRDVGVGLFLAALSFAGAGAMLKKLWDERDDEA